MGNCLKCGVYYCNCPADGYCSKCTNDLFKSSANTSGCKYTKSIIMHYDNILTCLNSMPTELSRIGMTNSDLNSYKSYIKSALNTTNYCQYVAILDKLTPIIQLSNAIGLCQM